MILRGTNCEPVHTCAPRLLLWQQLLEDFRGPTIERRRDVYFEPSGVVFVGNREAYNSQPVRLESAVTSLPSIAYSARP